MALPEEPYTRVERYLARLSGQNVDIPEYPITRIECYLDYLCGNGGGAPAPNAGAHNGIFRGQSLGTSYTDAQSQAITSGTFDDLFVGDYWTINDTVYRIAGFDLFLGIGYAGQGLTDHHAVIVPDATMYTGGMNSENDATTGYSGSKMKTVGLDAALSTVYADFGASHIITRQSVVCSGASATTGAPTSRIWISTQIDLMSEGQVYGRSAWGVQNQNGYNVGDRFSRFPLFALAPSYVICRRRQTYWLQDVRNATSFVVVSGSGWADASAATISLGVRPYFCLA